MESPTGASPWDTGLIRFYPFAECRLLTEEVPDSGHPRAHSLLCFADYSVWCWGYAIDLEDPANPVHVVSGSESVKVADSFRAFLVGYLAGGWAVTHPR